MLILNRRIGEAVTIGEDIVVTILDIRGGRVKVGVRAPGSLDVHREEVYQRDQQKKRDGGEVAAIRLVRRSDR